MILLYLFLSIFIGINIRVNIILGLIEALILLSLFIYRFRSKKVLLVLFGLGLGIGLSFIKPTYNYDTNKDFLVVEVKENYYIVSHFYERLYVYEKEHTHEVGDILSIKGEKVDFDFTVLESDFDFGEYLNKKGIYKKLIIKDKKVKFSNFIKINAWKNKFLSHLDEDTKSMVQSILFGGGSSSDTKELFQDLHLNRLISTSGLYLHAFDTLFMFLFSFISKKDKYKELGSLILLSLYSVLTFPRFVVIKFIVIKAMRFINSYLLNKKLSYPTIIALSGILFLLIDHNYAYQDSFLLAYFIPLLLFFTRNSFIRITGWKKKALLTGVIYISFIPFYLSYYHELSIFSFPLQVILTPFLLLYFLFSLLAFFGLPIYQGLNGFTGLFNIFLKNISPIMLKIYAPELPSFFILLYEVVFILVLYYLSIGNKDVYKIMISISVGAMTIYLIPIKPLITTSVSFINVGQGDSCLIHQGTTSILIDTGGSIYKDIAKDCLIPYFKKMQIYDIDLLITTHNDFDHMGAVSSLVNNFPVKEYVTDYKSFPLTINNITITNYNHYQSMWKEENDTSLVLSFSVKNTNFVITGDAPIKIEKQIMKDNKEIKCDILKVGHHGSKTSSCDEFISYLSPKEAVISCGVNNKYGHPHQEVLTILNRHKIKVRRTDLEGTIKYSFVF